MPALTPGAVIAGYRVERLLGRGGMGDVYLARHPRLPRYDALKLMSEELSRNAVYRQRFNSEADLACQVAHDSVVRVYDRGEDDDRLWLAMEYVDGRDLADILATEGRLSVDRSVALVQRIAAGLDAIHARGLLHRDVKPANILVTRDVGAGERALLTDFGIARSAADSLGLTGVGDIVATLHYAAPEQFEMRSGDLDRRVDVYALGCVLYEMLTGRVPIKGDTVAAFWNALQTQTVVPPSGRVPGIPPALDAVVARALNKDRDQRFHTAGELARAAATAARRPAPPPVPDTTFVDPKSVTAPGLGTLPSGRAHPTHGPTPPPQAPPPHSAPPRTPPPPATERSGQRPESPRTPYLPPLASPPVQPPPNRRRKWIIGGIAALLVAAGAVVAVLLLAGGDKPVPGVPRVLEAIPGRGKVTVRWLPGKGDVDHFVVYRDGIAIASDVPGLSYVDEVTNTDSHRYAIQAVNASGTKSGLSPQLTAAAQVRELNAAEKALLDKLPPTLVSNSSCEPILTGVDNRLDRALACQPNPSQKVTAPAKLPEAVNVYSATTRTALTGALGSVISAHSAKAGDCSTPPQQGTWNFTQTPNTVNGQIICYFSGRTSYLLWSYEPQLFYIQISTKNSYASLRQYWVTASLHLP